MWIHESEDRMLYSFGYNDFGAKQMLVLADESMYVPVIAGRGMLNFQKRLPGTTGPGA